ncbi:MAG TPA: hypothetical protein VNB22_03565 [Pyrinomonadaceae bacterium]|nr:hypothetical protein [Pyrinomonadaceae bacterium]
MRREISSGALPFYKATFLLFIGILVTTTIFTFIEKLKDFREMTQFQIFAYIFGIPAIIFMTFLFIRLALSWKKVEIDDEGLIITEANFFVRKTSTLVPFEKIKAARQNFFLRGNPGTVFVEFTEPTFFGNKISFVPTFRSVTFFEHPIVEEINQLANQNKRFIS